MPVALVEHLGLALARPSIRGAMAVSKEFQLFKTAVLVVDLPVMMPETDLTAVVVATPTHARVVAAVAVLAERALTAEPLKTPQAVLAV